MTSSKPPSRVRARMAYDNLLVPVFSTPTPDLAAFRVKEQALRYVFERFNDSEVSWVRGLEVEVTHILATHAAYPTETWFHLGDYLMGALEMRETPVSVPKEFFTFFNVYARDVTSFHTTIGYVMQLVDGVVEMPEAHRGIFARTLRRCNYLRTVSCAVPTPVQFMMRIRAFILEWERVEEVEEKDDVG